MPKAKTAKELFEDKFYAIAQEAIVKAEAVDCPLDVFMEGLKIMQSVLNDRVDQVTDEVKL